MLNWNTLKAMDEDDEEEKKENLTFSTSDKTNNASKINWDTLRTSEINFDDNEPVTINYSKSTNQNENNTQESNITITQYNEDNKAHTKTVEEQRQEREVQKDNVYDMARSGNTYNNSTKAISLSDKSNINSQGKVVKSDNKLFAKSADIKSNDIQKEKNNLNDISYNNTELYKRDKNETFLTGDEDKSILESSIASTKDPRAILSSKKYSEYNANDFYTAAQLNNEASTIEAKKINEKIENGHFVEALGETVRNNVIGGSMQSISGLINTVNTLAALNTNITGYIAKLTGNTELANKQQKKYYKQIAEGSYLNNSANHFSTVNSQINNDVVRTVGNVTNTVSEMGMNWIISLGLGYGLPNENMLGTAIQGISVGGRSAQEVLDENPDSIGRATLTGALKGTTSYFTEKMFDANLLTKGNASSISAKVEEKIYDMIENKYGREILNAVIGIVGENLEEIVEDNVDNLIDNLINDKDMPSIQEWLSNAKETAIVTTFSTAIMNLIGMGGTSFENKEANIVENKIQDITNKNGSIIQFNDSITAYSPDTETFYTAFYGQDGEIKSVDKVVGKAINNPNMKLTITPVVVRNGFSGTYNVVDADTGLLLDTAPYTTSEDAEEGFVKRVSSLDEATTKSINHQITMSKLSILNKTEEILQQSEVAYNETEKELENIIKYYTQEKQTDSSQNSITDVSNDNTTNYASQGSKTNTNKNRNYTGNSALDFSEQVDKWKNGEYNKNTHLVVLKETPQIYQDMGIDNLPITIVANKLDRIYNESGKQRGVYHGLKELVKQLPQAIENPLNVVESSTDNNSIVIITDLADNDGNIITVSLKLNGKGQLEIDNTNENADVNVLTSAYGRSNYDYQKRAINGKYTGWMQQNADNNRILYDVDKGIIKRPTNGQRLQLPNPINKSSTTNGRLQLPTNSSNIDNSITQKNKSVKSDTITNSNMQDDANYTTDQEIRDIVKYNPDGREIKDRNYVDFMVERYKDNQNISKVNIDTDYIKTLNDKTEKEMLDTLYNQIEEKSFKTEKQLLNEQNQKEKVLIDLEITKQGLKESINKSISDEKLAVIPYLDKLIQTSKDGIIRDENKNRRNIFNWYYIYNTAVIDNKLYAVKIDLKKTQVGDRFYVHRVNLINNKGNIDFVPSFEHATEKTAISPSVNNSITQKNKSVKSDTITNSNMQDDANYTTDQEIRDIVKYNPDGREIKDSNYVDFMVERYKDNKNISEIETDTKYVESLKGKSKKEKVDILYSKIQDKEFSVSKQLYNNINKLQTVDLDLMITKTGVLESFNKGFSDEKYAVVPYLDKIIKTSKDGVIREESKSRENINEWYYLYNTANINGELYSIKVDIKKTQQGDRFYVHRVNLIKKEGNFNSMRTPLEMEKSKNKLPSIDNSIPQTSKNVKGNDNATANKQSIQTSKNYTSSEDIRYMKKSTKQNIPVDENIQKELHNRIQNALLSKNTKKNTYLGEVSQKVTDKIKSLLGIDVSGRKHVIPDYNIRHIINQHGNQTIEETKGQIAVTTKDIEKIPDIINNYDRIEKGSINTNSITTDVSDSIRYIKQYNDNVTYVVEVVPKTGNTLEVKTMWKKPVRQKKNNSVSVGYDDNKVLPDTSKTKPNSNYSKLKNPIGLSHDNNNIVPPYTSETKSKSGSSTNSIQQNTENVKMEENNNTDIPDAKTNAEGADRYIEQEIKKVEAAEAWNNSIPITRRSDIRKTIEDYLGIGIQKGHFRQDAYGIYKANRDVIRVKEVKDIDNVLHEAGHALDLGNRIKVDKESISDELLQAVYKHGGYETDSRSVKLDEGFAEVVREYAIIPEQAKIDYPQTVAVLQGIQQENKNFDKFIRKIQEQTYNYIHQNPRNREISNQSIGKKTDRIPLSKEWLEQEIVRNVWDRDYATKVAVDELAKIQGKTSNTLKASDNAYILTRLASGVDTKAISMLSNGYIDENGVKTMPGLNQIGEILGNNPERFNDLRAYLVAKRDLEYKAKGLKTGLRTADSQAVIKQFENDTEIQESAQMVYDTLNGVLQYAVNNGLISQEEADSLRESNAFYVPMQRVLENDRGNQTGRRGAVKSIIRQRTGSELDIKDVLENIVANSVNIIQQVENNNILKAFYREGEASGLTGVIYDKIDAPMTKIGTAKLETWEAELKKQGVDTASLDLSKTIDLFVPNNKVDQSQLITSFIDDSGNRVYLKFRDELLFNSLMNMDKKFMSNVLTITSKLNQPLRYGATMANIGFAIPNLISDTVQAAIYSTAGYIPILDNILSVLDIMTATNSKVKNFMDKVAPEYVQKVNTLYTIYEQTGSDSSTRMGQYRKSTQENMPNVYGTNNSKVLGIDDKFKPLKRFMDILTYIPVISDNSTRFRVFEKNYKYYKKKGNSETDARIMAAIEARDATQDFGRTGNISGEINKVIPFSAARIGSGYTFAEKVKSNPKQVSFRIAVLLALAMAINGAGYDDKEIEELNRRKKDDNFVIKIGDRVWTFKKPQGILRSMVNLTEYVQDLCTGHIEEGKEGERLLEWLNNTITDNMPAESPLAALGSIPVLGGLAENLANKDFYYNTDIVKSYDLDLPDSEQYYDYNSQVAILLGNIFNYSPAKIDNLISSWFGGLGTQVTGTIDYILGKFGIIAEKPEMGAEQNAIGKRFVVNVNTNSASIDEIYDRKTELTKKKNGGTITEKETEELENITEAISKISALNKQIKAIKSDLTTSGEQKAEQIRPLQEQKTDVARQALGKDTIYTENEEELEALKFYPSRSTLTQSGYTLDLDEDMKKEYQELAYNKYRQYESQGIYNEEKLEQIASKCKDYAKNSLMKKYRSQLTRSK